ncbi:hypothetical protein CPB86DRAFT_677027, partial [Serendipita vermifera]
LLLYCARQLSDDKIPHRTTLMENIPRLFDKMMGTWITEIQNCLGRVSFTSDLWTDPTLHPFMAITAHYV